MENILFVILVVLARKTIARKCDSNKLKSDGNSFINNIHSGQYACPGNDDPPTHTECCWDGSCCPPLSDNQGDVVLKMICIVVITACLIVIISLLIGCFWGRGACYQCCRQKYSESDVAKYSLVDGSLRLMPSESSGNSLDLARIRVRPLEDV